MFMHKDIMLLSKSSPGISLVFTLYYINFHLSYEIKINEPLLDWVTGVQNNVSKLVIDNRK